MSSSLVMQRNNPVPVGATAANRSKKTNRKWRALKDDFQPGPYDVICARGKDAREHVGNRRMRLTVDVSLDRYRAASTKHEKSNIVWHIVDTVRAHTPDGGFVKYKDGKWFEVGDHWAREKVGQSFRDRLHLDYKSSSRAKTVRKRLTGAPGLLRLQQENGEEEINEHILEVSRKLYTTDEKEFGQMLVQANKAMLSDMKQERQPAARPRAAAQRIVSQLALGEFVPSLLPPSLQRDTSNLFAAPSAAAACPPAAETSSIPTVAPSAAAAAASFNPPPFLQSNAVISARALQQQQHQLQLQQEQHQKLYQQLVEQQQQLRVQQERLFQQQRLLQQQNPFAPPLSTLEKTATKGDFPTSFSNLHQLTEIPMVPADPSDKEDLLLDQGGFSTDIFDEDNDSSTDSEIAMEAV